MKNKFLLIAFSFLFVVSGITFYFTNQNINTYADSVPTASETHNVNFVAPDNSILYSTGDYVPSGSSLYDLEHSNLLLNSAFLQNTTGLNSYTAPASSTPFSSVDNWFLNWSSSLTINNNGFISLKFVRQYAQFRQFIDDFSNYKGQTLILTVKINNISHSSGVFLRIGDGTQNVSTSITGNGIFTRIINVSEESTELACGIFNTNATNTQVTLDIDYMKLEIGSSFTGYYNSEYINHLLQSYNFSNYYYDLDINQSITSNKYFFPSEITTSYDKGYIDGVDYATEMLKGFGIFNYSTYSLVNRYNYEELIGSFTGRFTEDNFVKYNGGFIIGSNLFHAIDVYLSENEIDDVVFKIDFDSPVSVNTSPFFVFYNFGFGNQVEFIFTDGTNFSLSSADERFDEVSLENYPNSYIKSIVLGFSSNFPDYGQVGISSNVDYSNAYNNGLTNGFDIGYDNGYLIGLTDGKVSGYNSGYTNGLADGGNYSFFSLFGAVLDAPVKTLTGLFNFDLLGVNLWRFFTALFTLAVIILIVKLCLGGK